MIKSPLKSAGDILQEAGDKILQKRLDNYRKYCLDNKILFNGFGGSWSITCPECKKDTMQIVRPGKVQCSHCE